MSSPIVLSDYDTFDKVGICKYCKKKTLVTKDNVCKQCNYDTIIPSNSEDR